MTALGRLVSVGCVVLVLLLGPAARADAAGAWLEVQHEDALGTSGAWFLRSVEWLLDGKPLEQEAEGALHPLPVGLSSLDVRAVYEGRSAFFSYVEGYRFVMRARVTLDARAGDTVRVVSSAYEVEGMTVEWERRPAFLVRGQPAEAIIGIEYGPEMDSPRDMDVATRVVEDVLAEARRLSGASVAHAPGDVDMPERCRLGPVYFAFFDTRLSPEAEAELRRAAECLLQRPGLRVRLSGHADVKGPESVNATLGQGRAQSVAARLQALGVSGARLVLETRGAEQPPCDESTPECFARSRRVELVAEPSPP
ncbi:OmpA family protein [Myxococcus sp. K15C18031901]|uniref:OmpA family protein n=1 Tax=Myxococcus dinghuensis TaxID=2906761 RepID=UPI0020A73DC8|nr:OmpA family protein [Myxococcus dinghuensis]MCP3101744.1 OmpA family protein [Myxococcus dinghuensis]